MRFTLLQSLLLTGPTLAFGAWFAHRARRESRTALFAFIGLAAYAFSLELADVLTTQDYSYSDLGLMIGRAPAWVPLEVPISWAVIVTCAMRTSDRLALPWRLRPLFDGLMALSLDLVLDPILSASRAVPALGGGCLTGDQPALGGLGMWIWCLPPGEQALWLRVPLTNFFGWVVVVSLVSFAVRHAARSLEGSSPSFARTAWVFARNLLGALVAVVLTLLAYRALVTTPWMAWAVLGLAVAAVVLVLAPAMRAARLQNPVDVPVVAFLLSMILPYGALFFWRGQGTEAGLPMAMAYAGAIGVILLLTASPYLRGTRAR